MHCCMANFWRSIKLFTAYQRLYFTSLDRRIHLLPAVTSRFSSLPIICGTNMSLTCSHIPLALESPFSHIDVYGVEHPAFGKTSSSGRGSLSRRKSKPSTHKGAAISIKPKRSVVSVSSRSSHASSTHKTVYKKKKKKKKEASNPSGNSTKGDVLMTMPLDEPIKKDSKARLGSSCQERAQFHPMKSPPCVRNASLARVDADSPVLARQKSSLPSSKQTGHWRVDSKKTESRPLNVPNDSTSGHGPVISRSNKTRAQTFIQTHSDSRTLLSSSKLSMLSQSTSTTKEVMFSLNRSQHNLKTQIINSPINVSLKKASQNISSQPSPMRQPKRVFETASGLKSRGGARRKDEPMTMEDIAWGLARLQYRNVIVMSGAGISTPSGIPDFRSPGTGLYDNLQQYKIPDPTAIFDIGYFARNPKPFFALAKELYPGNYDPNHTHYFVRLLQEKGVLLRSYTQNIDGLERIAGISPGKLVEAHGSFSTASCIKCKTKQDSEEVKENIFSDKIPRCKHKYCSGLVKPDIVFFGEDLPSRFHSLQLRDFSKCDLLIIMGTSLEVEPFASLSTLPRFDVPRLLVNRDLVGPFKRHRMRVTDVAVTCDLVEGVCSVLEEVGWMSDLQRLMGVAPNGEEGVPDREMDVPTIEVQTVASEDVFSSISDRPDIPVIQISPSLLQTEPTESTSRVSCERYTERELASKMSNLKLENVPNSTNK